MKGQKRFVAFTTLTYLEDSNWDIAFSRCGEHGYPFAYVIHDKDRYLDEDHLPDGKNLGDPEKVHCQSLIRVSNAQSVSAFSKNCGVPERFVQGLNSWRAFCLYLLHRDTESKLKGKHMYNKSEIHGNYRDEVIGVIENEKVQNYNKSREDENSIMDVINYIESFSCSISTAQLVRWASESGLYSVYRRSAGIISNVLKEHNMSCQHSLQESLWELRLKDMEKRLSDAERELERAYGDLHTRVVNPWTGKCIADKDIEYTQSIRKLNDGIKNILKKA